MTGNYLNALPTEYHLFGRHYVFSRHCKLSCHQDLGLINDHNLSIHGVDLNDQLSTIMYKFYILV